MSAIDLGLTSQQAAALLPLLQKIAAGQDVTRGDSAIHRTPESGFKSSSNITPRFKFPVVTPSRSFSPTEACDFYDSSGYSAEELFTKTAKNSKPTEAQKHLKVCLCFFFFILSSGSCLV